MTGDIKFSGSYFSSPAMLSEGALHLNAFDLARFAVTTAAEILHYLRDNPLPKGSTQAHPAVTLLQERHIDVCGGLDVNYLIYKAAPLFALVEAEVTMGGRRVLWALSRLDNRFYSEIDASRKLIAEALQALQVYKTEVVRLQKVAHGVAHWGDATNFNQMDWAQHNQAFLTMEMAESST
jgi:hypothetical protein